MKSVAALVRFMRPGPKHVIADQPIIFPVYMKELFSGDQITNLHAVVGVGREGRRGLDNLLDAEPGNFRQSDFGEIEGDPGRF